MEGTDYNRPRRPNSDTLVYLKSLPFDEKYAHQEIKAYLSYQEKIKLEDGGLEDVEEVEYPQVLSAALAALDEIKHEIASLAGDEFGSQCIETISRIVAPYSTNAARKLLFGVTGYMIHLSTHRYGSHVLQTIMQSTLEYNGDEIAKMLDLNEEEKQQDESGHEVPELKHLIISISQEISPVCKDMAVHICGSHVLRSLLCILGGCVETIPHHIAVKEGTNMESGGTRRGKVKSKKKKKKNKSVMMAEGVLNNANYAQYRRVPNSRVDSEDVDIMKKFQGLVYGLTCVNLNETDGKELNERNPGELQQLACNPSAGPLLIVLLNILIHRSHQIEKTATALKDQETQQEKANKHISDFRLGISAPDLRFKIGCQAEKFLKHILCWDESTVDGKQEKAGDIIYGLSGETRGSHLVECILRKSNDTFYDAFCKAGNFFNEDAFEDYCRHDVSNFVIQTLFNTVRSRDQAEQLIKCAEKLINNGYVIDRKNKRRGIFFRAVQMAAKFRIGQEKLLKCMQRGFGSLDVDGPLAIEDCVTHLIDYRQPEVGKRFVELDAIGARTVYQLLRFVPRLCGEVLGGIVSKYDVSHLICMCNDGLASKCIIDGILDGPTKHAPFSQSVTKLFQKLRGSYVELAVERIGHHTVKKMFIKLEAMDERASLSEELANGINRLNGNAMGRSVIADCAVKDIMAGKEVWEATVKKRLEEEAFLKDITDANNGAEKKRKRKRKKSSNHSAEGSSLEDDDTKKSKLSH